MSDRDWPRSRRLAAAGAATVLLLVARGPLHRLAASLPLTNDDALVVLMARAVAGGEPVASFWNQPYGGTLDAWLLAPFSRWLAPASLFRAHEWLGAALVVFLSGLLARRCSGEAAGWAALGLAAVAPPYVALVGALGMAPHVLAPALVAWPLLLAARVLDGERTAPGWCVAAGLAAGLGVWNSLVILPALAGAAAGLAAARAAGGAGRGRGAAGRATSGAGRCLPVLALAALAGTAPLLLAPPGPAEGPEVAGLRPPGLWLAGLADLGRALAGFAGLQVPLVVDGPVREHLPWPLPAALGVSLLALVVAGAWDRRAWPAAAWALAVVAGFALSGRARGDRVRYLYPLAVPLLALAGAGLARAWRWRRSVAVVAGLAVLVPWLDGHGRLAAGWRDPSRAPRFWGVPPLAPAVGMLEAVGARGAYASLQFAGRLTMESGGRVVASQAWNERFPGFPLRHRDLVDVDPAPAWVLDEAVSRGMPRSGAFRALLAPLGGSWREARVGSLTVFHGFVPPFDESRPLQVLPSVLPAALVDRDTATCAPALTRLEVPLVAADAGPVRVAAVVLLLTPGSPPVEAWEALLDGTRVAQGPARHGLQWLGGAPRAGEQGALSVVVDRAGRRLDLHLAPALRPCEVFAYGPEAPLMGARGVEEARAGLEAARGGDWVSALRRFAEAARLDPERASRHLALVRARGRVGPVP